MAYIKVTIVPVIIETNKTNNVWWKINDIIGDHGGFHRNCRLQVDLHMYTELCGNEAWTCKHSCLSHIFISIVVFFSNDDNDSHDSTLLLCLLFSLFGFHCLFSLFGLRGIAAEIIYGAFNKDPSRMFSSSNIYSSCWWNSAIHTVPLK